MADPIMIGPRGREQRSRPLLRTMLGDVLRRARLEQGRTLADVARAARVSMPYLSEVERGRKEASSEILAAICDALRVELSDVLAEVGRDLSVDRAAGHAIGDHAIGDHAATPPGQISGVLSGAGVIRLGAQAFVPSRSPGDAMCLLAA